MDAVKNKLAEQIHRIEQADRERHVETWRLASGWPLVDAVLNGGLISGAIHEWFFLEPGGREHARAMWRPPMAVLVHMAKRAIGAKGGPGGAVWIGQRCWPHGHSLAEGTPSLMRRSLFVDVTGQANRWWAIDLAARSRAVKVVIADGSGLSMSGSRRLQLAAESGGSIILLSRPVQERATISAATTRWALTPQVSETPWPRWRLALWRCKRLQCQAGTDSAHQWLLEGQWSRGRGLVVVSAEPGDRSAVAKLATSESRRKQA